MDSSKTWEAESSRLDRIFIALADATRRDLLDRLYHNDGQRAGQLAEGFAISRQAISRHLEVLEDAELVVTRREARETRHFLNRAPIRELQNHWIAKYTRLHPRIDCF
jgi:DNA-binding transcriptional ArsR family regulator